MKRYLPFIIVFAVAFATLTGATMLYWAKRPATLTLSTNSGTENKPGEVHARGPENAPVTLEEFGDYQCPPCGMLAGPINQLAKDYGSNLRVVFHNFPLITHQHAREAACAAEAAALQGRFWEMHDLLYREQPAWSKAGDVRPLFSAYAGILHLDVNRFNKDMDSEAVKKRVADDQKHGASIGVQNTPTIFLNNQALDPTTLNPTKLRAAVDLAVKAGTKKSTSLARTETSR